MTFQYERVWEIYNKIHPKPDDFLSAERFFVREGKMLFRDEQKKKKKKRHFFLFNDMLIFCRREGVQRYYLRILITLRAQNVSVEEIPIDFQFRIKTRLKSFILICPSAQFRKDWMADITRSINGTHDEELRHKGKVVGEKTEVGMSTITGAGVSASVGAGGKVMKEDYYKQDIVKDLLKDPKTKSEKSSKSGGKKKEKEKAPLTDSSSESSEEDSSESPKKASKTKSNRRSAKVGDLLGLGVEISNNLTLGNPISPRSAGLTYPAQSPVNPFLIAGGVQQPVNPFVTPTPTSGVPLVSPRGAIGVAAPRSGVTPVVNPFLQPTSGTLVNPFLNT